MPAATGAAKHEPALDIASVRFAWPGSPPFTLEVDAFRLDRGEKVLLLGSSGSGKSTLLGLVCGIIAPASGHIAICGTDIARLPGRARDVFRADHIGVIFQMFNLLSYATPLHNILLALRFSTARRRRVENPREEALALCSGLGLPEATVTGARAGRLSVGQQQRVAIARALIGAPELIVADEPTSALDASAQASFLNILFEQVDRAGSSLLMVSHDERIAGKFDRTVELASIARTLRSEAA